jgi:epoxyqueuosine reductase
MLGRNLGDIKSQLKRKTQELGFDLVGVTSPEPPPHLDVYNRWIELGRQGEMGYLARQDAIERRSDPRTILSDCKSILVVAANYAPSNGELLEGEASVAAYALGIDYHKIFQDRLKRLLHSIQNLVGEPVTYRIYCDTGPLLERELAQRAGLGWIGKNTCLINPSMGSYVLLGEMLLGLELEPDKPFTSDQCGTCTRCIQACPTGCILPDRTLDARRCISYLTIELKGAIPAELRSDLGDWIFGCDICQQVCPWNRRFSKPADDISFMPQGLLAKITLNEHLALNRADFEAQFRVSAVRRAKYHGFMRNVTTVAGNLGKRAFVPALSNLLLGSQEPLIRSHAAWALGQIGGANALEGLNAAVESEKDKDVLVELIEALRNLKNH